MLRGYEPRKDLEPAFPDHVVVIAAPELHATILDDPKAATLLSSLTLNRDSAVQVPVFGTRYTDTAPVRSFGESGLLLEKSGPGTPTSARAPSKVIDVPMPSHGSLPLAAMTGADQPPLAFRLET